MILLLQEVWYLDGKEDSTDDDRGDFPSTVVVLELLMGNIAVLLLLLMLLDA